MPGPGWTPAAARSNRAASSRRVEARLAELPGVVHLSSRGAAWHGRQDVYVCQGARD